MTCSKRWAHDPNTGPFRVIAPACSRSINEGGISAGHALDTVNTQVIVQRTAKYPTAGVSEMLRPAVTSQSGELWHLPGRRLARITGDFLRLSGPTPEDLG